MPKHLTYGIYWRSRAGELFPGRRQRRRPLDALAYMMFRSWSLAVHIFGERTTRSVRRVEVSKKQQTNYSGHHEKAHVGRGGADRAGLVQGPGRARDSGTAPIIFAGTPPRSRRTSAWAEETTATQLEDTESKRSKNWL